MPRLIWVFAGCTVILLVLSCRGSHGESATYEMVICGRGIWKNLILKVCDLWPDPILYPPHPLRLKFIVGGKLQLGRTQCQGCKCRKCTVCIWMQRRRTRGRSKRRRIMGRRRFTALGCTWCIFDNSPIWISGRDTLTVEMNPWPISTKECCRTGVGSSPESLNTGSGF